MDEELKLQSKTETSVNKHESDIKKKITLQENIISTRCIFLYWHFLRLCIFYFFFWLTSPVTVENSQSLTINQ